MSDIVERLRLAAKHPHNQHGPNEWLEEAAAEIERLRAALGFYAGWPRGPAGNIAPLLLDAGQKARAALAEEKPNDR